MLVIYKCFYMCVLIYIFGHPRDVILALKLRFLTTNDVFLPPNL